MKLFFKNLQLVVDSEEGRITKAMPFFILIISMALGFFLFFDRYPIFHDEIINTYKASTGLVFDYAMRPVYYSLNYFFYHFLGGSPRSLTIAALVYYAITASLLFSIGQRHVGLLGGLLCSIIYMFMPLVIHTGIRGMPHLPAGLMAIVILNFISKLFESPSDRSAVWYMMAIAIFSILMLATHPTMMGFFIATLLWAVAGFLFSGRYYRLFYPDVLKRKHFAIILISSIVTFALLNLSYRYFDGRYYLLLFLKAITNTNNTHLFPGTQPWFWYFSALIRHGSFINIIVILFVVGFFISIWSIKGQLDLQSPSLRFLIISWASSLIFIVSISFINLKFERVFVSFIPFYALSAGLTMSYIARWFIKNGNSSLYSFVAVLMILAGVVWGAGNFVDHYRNSKIDPHKARERYYGLYSQLNNIVAPDIGVVGDSAAQVFARRYITIAGKKPVILADSLRELSNDNGSDTFKNALLAGNVEYFLIPTGRKSAREDLSNEYLSAFERLVSIGATKLYTWRGLIEIWHFDLIPQSSDFYTYLSMANPRGRIGVYGTEKEVGEDYFRRFNYISVKFNLRIYPLVSQRRTAEKNMGFVDRNDVSMLLLPVREIPGVDTDRLNGMKLYLAKSKWKYIDTVDHLGIELWVRSSK